MALGLTVADLRAYLDQVPDIAAQRITVTGSPTGGTYTLSYASSTTVAIAYNATAATVQAALTTVASPGTADPTPLNVYGRSGGPYLVVFSTRSGRTASTFALANNSLTGGTTPSVTVASALDAVMTDIIERAERVIEDALAPVVFTSYGTATSKDIRAGAMDSTYLKPPIHQAGSVTTVKAIPRPGAPVADEELVEDWIQDDGYLIRGDQWLAGQWYRVTAIYGYGPAPASAQQLALEIAVNIWRSKDRGLYSEVQGANDGANISYVGGLNPTQRMMIQNIRRQYREIVS